MAKRVAIIGFSFRFPGTNVQRFWSDLLDGRYLITNIDPGRWTSDPFYHGSKAHPGTSYTFAAGSIGDAAGFDADFFGISPREAALMDPQQRLLLELGWEVLENSGVKPLSLRGSNCGVYIGISNSDYCYRLADDLAAVDSFVATGNTFSIAANRLSYFFDLHGPSMAIDTGCSSSLVAFHQACRSIVSGETTQALAGGVNLHLHPYGFITFSKASMLSREGRCKVFDASADGYVRSEGGGLFLLKDYDQALSDGDRILAVVSAVAVNTDGHKSSLTVPSADAQTALLEHVYKQAGIEPGDIDYIEAHGTGTPVGDPIEARSLSQAIGKRRPTGQPLPIGSVKSNLGHLEAAAGVAGLVKALYCIEHRLVPATIGMETPNPSIPFDDWNIEVVTENRPLEKAGKLIVGVNAFGFGGANAHVILESSEDSNRLQSGPLKSKLVPIILSARSEIALKATARDFSAFLRTQPEEALYDIAHNTIFRREWHEHRAVLFETTLASTAKALEDFADDAPDKLAVESGCKLEATTGLAFIYSGNGSHWSGMGKRLIEEVPLFRKTIREVDAIFCRYGDFSLEAELEGKNGDDRYKRTEIAQPALFAFQVGVTRLLQSRGISACSVAGHSVGEVAAAWASGALSLEAAVQVIYHRSRFQGTTKGCGQMSAVVLGESEALALLDETGFSSTLTLAGMNSPRGVTIAGSASELLRFETILSGRNISYKRLDLDYAFHSPAMDNIQTGIMRELVGLQAGEALIPYYSTVTGELLDGCALDANYWKRNVRNPVLFEKTIKSMLAEGITAFVEIGPHSVLRSYICDCMNAANMSGRVITTGMYEDDDPQRIWGAACQAVIACGDVAVNWERYFPAKGRLVQLPNYPWQREHHWHTVTPECNGLLNRKKVHPLLGYRLQQHDLTWENQLDTHLYPTFGDHVVGDAIVFPGTGFAEFALAAALTWSPGEYAEIEDLEIRSPLLLSSKHSTVVRLSIDQRDGGFTIKSREHVSSESWALHAMGRILTEPGNALLRQELPVIPVRAPDFDGILHNVLTHKAGLSYGSSFQAIDHGWCEGCSVLGVYRIPEQVQKEFEHYHLHPAILDCAFQLIIQFLKEDLSIHEGVAFVPQRIGRIALHSGKAIPHFALATLLRRAPHSLTADFTIFDADGIPLAVVKEARFRSVRLYKNVADRISFLGCHGIPKPHPFAPNAAPPISFEQYYARMAELTRRCAKEDIYHVYTKEIDPLLESLCSHFTLETLQEIAGSSRYLSPEIIDNIQTSNPDIKPFLGYLIETASNDVSIEATETGWRLIPDRENRVSTRDIWNSLFADYPCYFLITHSVGLVGQHLKALLEGCQTLNQVCPHSSSLAALSDLVLGAEMKCRIGQALKELISSGLDNLPEGRRFGIIELSEGKPMFAADICGTLDFNRADYMFATTLPETVDEARRLLEEFPAVDIRQTVRNSSEADPPTTGQSFFQLAIVSFDFSTLESALVALEYASRQLTGGGTILLVAYHPMRWVDFIFGARPGWWAKSTGSTHISSQQSPLFWQQQMERLGFSSVSLLEFSPGTASGPFLLLARSERTQFPIQQPHERGTRNWLIIADEADYPARMATQLTGKLQARGDRVVRIQPGDSGYIASALTEERNSHGEFYGIIHLAGLNSLATDSDPSVCLANQVDRCATTAATIQACEATKTHATHWLITAGAMTSMLPGRDHMVRCTSAALIADASLWGFGTTLMNETSSFPIRIVDLEDPADLETIAVALEREFEQPDSEQEIVLTASGERFVPRLQLEPQCVSSTEKPEGGPHPLLRLGFEFPGSLRNLRWEAHPHIQPADNELEVEVHATGLNFRDFMYTIGLLSDEAVESGYAGPTLGLEFSGLVLQVGAKTIGFKPGDRVMGFGPASFSNRVVTSTGSVTHIPNGFSFEAAATIPAAFFTAYYALHYLARLQDGEKVLIHGAAGGVGIAAIQVARWCGAEIYATAGSEEKRDFLRLLGVEHIFNSRSLAFADEILEQTGGEGVDVVLNSLAGEAINRNLRVLKPLGRFLELGKRDFYENSKMGMYYLRNNIAYHGIDVDQLMQQRPEFAHGLFSQVIKLFAEGTLYPLPYHLFEAQNITEAFRYMQQSRQIGKIIVGYNSGIRNAHTMIRTKPRKLVLSSEVSYLVTGGLRGFGLKAAERLAARGARNLVLINRRGPVSAEAATAIDWLERQAGVTVHAVQCDVTDRLSLSALLKDISNRFPPLRGVIHAATVIDDRLVRNMSRRQIHQVLAPKILGAHYLHEMTRDIPLDFFVLFSSATTLFGNPGQGNYVAANTWIEALAKLRRAMGLPATCIRWGAINDVGFLARNERIKEVLLNRMGGSAIDSSVALDIMESLLLTNRSGVGILELDWKALRRFLPCSGTPKFDYIRHLVGNAEMDESHTEDIKVLLMKLSDPELLEATANIVKHEVGGILRVSPEKININRSMYDMGLDSLMGVELAAAVESRFHVRLPVIALSENPTILKLAGRIVKQLREDSEAANGDRELDALAQVQMVVAQHGAKEVSSDAIAEFAKDIHSGNAIHHLTRMID